MKYSNLLGRRLINLWLILSVLFVAISITDAQRKTPSTKKGKTKVVGQKGTPKKRTVVIETSLGAIAIELNDSAAPKHSTNFRRLAKEGFYQGTTFHRVIPGFMIQGGGFDEQMSQNQGKAPIKNEAANGLKNDTGVISWLFCDCR